MQCESHSWAQPVKLSARCRSLGCVAILLLLTACMAEIPIAGSPPEGLPDGALLESHTGHTRAEVEAAAGPPDEVHEAGDVTLCIYREVGPSHILYLPIVMGIPMPVIFPGGIPVPIVMPGGEKAGAASHCVVLRYEKDRLVSFDSESSGSGEPCSRLFASSFDELESIRRAARRAALRVEARRGSRDAAVELARSFDDLEPLRALAAKGDREAALTLARTYEEPAPAMRLVERGDKEAAQELGRHFFQQAERGDDAAARWTDMCIAAQAGHPRAQHLLAARHHTGRPGPVERDDVGAYLWYSLAALNGDTGAAASRQTLAMQMTPGQVTEGDRRVRSWRPRFDDCNTDR